jgi:DHA1 family bicyclomycin/chloramphenicol resistance-like MFS transporter
VGSPGRFAAQPPIRTQASLNTSSTQTSEGTAKRYPLPFREFIPLMALLMSMTAMSIDIMLPALPDIGETLGVRDSGNLPLVVTVFMVGMAIGQLVWGPLADRFGRRRPLLLGLAIFVLATTVVITTQGFTQLLAGRFLQGIGGSVGRIIVTAIVRDRFVGREMARVMSMIMMVFILVPILAPSLGQLIILVGTWRWLFAVLLAASLTSLIWAWQRLPETQPPLALRARRRTLAETLVLVLSNRITFGYGIACGFVLGFLVAYIASAQQVFGAGYGLGKLFPFAFGSVASAIALASFANSRLVRRLGMRRLSHTALVAHVGLSAALALLGTLAPLPLWLALGGMIGCFFLYGLILSNFNAIAMQPMGHSAGMAASLTGSYATGTGALLGTLIAGQFDGTILPLFTGFAVLGCCALLSVFAVEGRSGMFRGE